MTRWVFLHSSDEQYGADRMLARFLAALPAPVRARAQVWLPDDVDHGPWPLCRQLAEQGIDVSHRPLPVLRRDYLTPAGALMLAQRRRATLAALRAARPDTVVLATSALLPVAPGLPRDVRVVLHLQELWGRREAAALGLAARRVDRIVAISRSAAAGLPASLRARTVVVPNATAAPDRLTPVDPAGGALRYLVAGRWNRGKGHEYLLRAWAAAGQPGELVVLGGPPPTGAGADVPGLVAALSLAGSVRIVGEVADIGPHLARADVMVVPSLRPEAFGLVSIEAFAHGRPVIATDHGGSTDIVAGGAGWRVPAGDVTALAGLLRRLDRPTVAAAGARARERYDRHYRISDFGPRLRAALV